MLSSVVSWQEGLKTALRTHEDLENFFQTSFPKNDYPIFIPIELAKRIKQQGIESALAKQFLPHVDENNKGGMLDPIGDHAHSPTKQIVHRYHNRLLFFPTSVCPVQCRYCFRKNELHSNDDLFKPDFAGVRDYVSKHPEIEEVIFSGGDPLMLSNDKLEKCFDEFADMNVSMIRLHTRMPIVMPSRLDEGFVDFIKRSCENFELITIVLHLNHVDEITPELTELMKELRVLPIQWLSQSVLLKGVNDNTSSLKDLFLSLVKIGIKPYYLHHPDQVRGGMHFWLDIEDGRRIFAALRNQVPGHALPQYVIDIPGGHGKTPLLNPEGFEFNGQLLNKDGELVSYFLN